MQSFRVHGYSLQIKGEVNITTFSALHLPNIFNRFSCILTYFSR
nr:MAG TPA: hypothetical protein [Caudoviricetes sp.]